jgi:hypothetical protein
VGRFRAKLKRVADGSRSSLRDFWDKAMQVPNVETLGYFRVVPLGQQEVVRFGGRIQRKGAKEESWPRIKRGGDLDRISRINRMGMSGELQR